VNAPGTGAGVPDGGLGRDPPDRARLGQLAGEQAALRRVATLVAQATPPEVVFAAVAEEVAQLFRVELANLYHYGPDRTQQRLVALGLAARAAQAGVPADRDDLRAELSDIAAGLADAVAELQEFSRGIHPAVLSDGGLGPALRTLARRSAVPVELEVTTKARFPEPVEVAAYYVASEALANAMKHAQASRVEISLATLNGHLLLSVRDDGIGGADPARGSGLAGLTDRVEALGGSIRLDSAARTGTLLTAQLPLEYGLAPDVV
jgi:signal transduction histidine kinase